MHTGGVGRVLEHVRRSAADDAALVAGYAADRDEDAFAELVRRHGPMVLGVCRRVLRNEADAADAFQATFLVLVRKASTLREPGRVANWLYGVARHVASRAKLAAERRRRHELASGGYEPSRSPEHDDLADALDAELARLPADYRLAVVLCDLEGRTIRAAAESLGWPIGTVSTRLTRGRARLAKRLLARGLAPGVAAGVPAALLTSTLRAATAFAAGAAGAVPAAEGLANEVLKAMLMNRHKLVLATLVAAGAVLAGVGHVAGLARADKPAAVAVVPAQKEKAPPAADEGQAALVKQLEGVQWYLDGHTEPGTISVSDESSRSLMSGQMLLDTEQVFMAGPNGPLSLRDLPVAKEVKVTVDGQPAKLADLRTGWAVAIRFDDKLAVADIKAIKPKPGYTIQAVDAAKRTLTVTAGKDGPAMTFAVGDKAYIYVFDKGNEGTLADLAAGMRVTLSVRVEGGRLWAGDIRVRK